MSRQEQLPNIVSLQKLGYLPVIEIAGYYTDAKNKTWKIDCTRVSDVTFSISCGISTASYYMLCFKASYTNVHEIQIACYNCEQDKKIYKQTRRDLPWKTIKRGEEPFIDDTKELKIVWENDCNPIIYRNNNTLSTFIEEDTTSDYAGINRVTGWSVPHKFQMDISAFRNTNYTANADNANKRQKTHESKDSTDSTDFSLVYEPSEEELEKLDIITVGLTCSKTIDLDQKGNFMFRIINRNDGIWYTLDEKQPEVKQEIKETKEAQPSSQTSEPLAIKPSAIKPSAIKPSASGATLRRKRKHKETIIKKPTEISKTDILWQGCNDIHQAFYCNFNVTIGTNTKEQYEIYWENNSHEQIQMFMDNDNTPPNTNFIIRPAKPLYYVCSRV
jgi:hypothetical protein